MNDYRVVFHVDEKERMPVAVGNIINLVKDAESGKPEIELVINGSAIGVFSDETVLQQLAAIHNLGAKIVACRNSIRMFCNNNPECPAAEDKLPSFVEVVRAGVTEIIKRQHEGYAYIKP